jgi:cytochrome c oxidase assembly factor CtaG
MSIWVDANGWPVPPTVLLGCLIAEILYFRGWRILVKAEQAKKAARARANAKVGPTINRGTLSGGQVSPTFIGSDGGEYQWDSWFWRGAYFLGAIVIFLLASSAPIDILSSRLFWVHMVQHLLLMVVMAPLLVAGAPLLPMWLGLPNWTRRLIKRLKAGRAFYQVGRWLRQPVISCALLIIGMWLWHWPSLYDLALTNATIHDWCEHATFVAVSFLFWTQVIPSPPLRPRLGYLGRIGYVGIAIAQNIVLAVLIGFTQVPLYAYAHLVHGPGALTALQDQQLGAGIMWTFGDLPFGIAFSVLVHRWLTSQMDDTTIAMGPYHNTQKETLAKTESIT